MTVPFKDAQSSWRSFAGKPVHRGIHSKLGDFVSILDFGVRQGTDGVDLTENTARFQAAVDAQVPLYFPQGDYYINATIKFQEYLVMRGIGSATEGANPARILGNFNGPMFCQATKEGVAGYFDTVGNPLPDLKTHQTIRAANVTTLHEIQNLCIINYDALGECVVILGTGPQSNLTHCQFRSKFRGVYINGFESRVVGCRIWGDGSGAKSGLLTGDGSNPAVYEANMQAALECYGLKAFGYVEDTNFMWWGTGLALAGNHPGLARVRIEVCRWGLVVGGFDILNVDVGAVDQLPSSRALLHSVSLEANLRGLWLRSAGSALSLRNIGMQGSIGAPPEPTEVGLRMSEWGFRCDAAPKDVIVEGLDFGGEFSKGAVVTPGSGSFRNIRGAEANSSNARAHLGGRHPYSRAITGGHIQLNGPGNWPANYALTDAARQTISFLPDLHLRGLNGLNLRDTNALANNLGGVAAVTVASTSVAIAFEGAVISNLYAFDGSPTLVADGGSKLPAGTYYYATTVATKIGETGLAPIGTHSYRGPVATSLGQKVRMTFHGSISAAMPRRIYRGRAPNSFDGFWEITSGTSFEDSGQAFHGVDIPTVAWDIPSRHEVDTNYQVVVTPSWNTTAWVVEAEKQTSGFAIRFGTAAPANAVVRWILFRP